MSYIEGNIEALENKTLEQKHAYWFDQFFALGFMAIVLSILLQPFFNCFYKTARYELLKTIGNIVIAPFGSVRFRDFFFADILTSASTTFKDVGLIAYLLTRDQWTHIDAGASDTLQTYYYVVAILPFWWRFWQCLNKAYNSGNMWQLLNAGKYASKIVPTVVVILGGQTKMDWDSTFVIYFSS
mmetsp:Transcript_8894/g.13673  ORF Transcript_8894/g.13673 Transcript_8894/m.13673 type:complete len:184 (-) Transcript_8894:374-925(-)